MADQKKTVLITGATRGIGLALAQIYTTNGWNVIATARNVDTADKLKALAPYKLVQLDATDEASILEAAKTLDGAPIDLLINNAGISNNDTFATATKASIMEQFEVNAVGPFLVTRALLPNLRAAVTQNGSAVVGHISSIIGVVSEDIANHLRNVLNMEGMYGYGVSKTALNKINATLAHDLKKDKITAVVLHPGYVSTDMTNHNAHISPDESVAGISKVLAGITLDDAGKFFNYDGSALPW